MKGTRLLPAIAFLVLISEGAAAQMRDSARVGMRVRVYATNPASSALERYQSIGRITTLSDTRMTVARDSSVRVDTIPYVWIKTLEIHTGYKSRTQTMRSGAIIGGVLGVAVMGLLQALDVKETPGQESGYVNETARLEVAAIPLGVAFGVIAGALNGGDQWKRVPPPMDPASRR